MNRFRVGRAKTGLGLFATAPIARGAFIVEYFGERIPTPRAKARERMRGSRYIYEVNSRWSIDGAARGNLARYINHSCRPNAQAYIERGRIVLRGLRAIAPGEEIACDYGREYFELFIVPIGCKCAACAP